MAGADPAHPLAGSQPGSELVMRIASAIILAPLAVGVAYLGGWAFVAFWALAEIVRQRLRQAIDDARRSELAPDEIEAMIREEWAKSNGAPRAGEARPTTGDRP